MQTLKAFYNLPYDTILGVGSVVPEEFKSCLQTPLDAELGASFMEGTEAVSNWTVGYDGELVRVNEAVIELRVAGFGGPREHGRFGTIKLIHSSDSSIIVVRFLKHTDYELDADRETILRLSVYQDEEPDLILDTYEVFLSDILTGQVTIDHKTDTEVMVMMSHVDGVGLEIDRVQRLAPLIAPIIKRDETNDVFLPTGQHERLVCYKKVSSEDVIEGGVVVYWAPKHGKEWREPGDIIITLDECGGVKYKWTDDVCFTITVCRQGNIDAPIFHRTFTSEEMVDIETGSIVIPNIAKKSNDIDIYSNLIYRDLYFVTWK